MVVRGGREWWSEGETNGSQRGKWEMMDNYWMYNV